MELSPMQLYRGLATLLAVSIAVAAYSGVIILYGGDPVEAYLKMFRNAFLDPYGLRETMRLAAALGIISLGLSIVFRAGLWNIGAEGQYVLGGLAAGYVVYILSLHGGGPVVPLLMGALIGGLYAALPGVLRWRLGVNEVLTTLMLNYVALYLLYYVVYGVWRDPQTGFPVTPEIPSLYRLPEIGGFVGGLAIMLLLAPVLYHLLFHTRYGFKLRVYGLNREAAEYAGYDRRMIIVSGLFISGFLAGLAGAGDFLGSYYRLMPRFSSGLGYTAIIVALLASNHPLLVPIASILFAGFLYGSYTLAIVADIPTEATYLMTGLLLAMLVSTQYLERWIGWLARRL